jgi:hypothetical protein
MDAVWPVALGVAIGRVSAWPVLVVFLLVA